MKIVATGAVSIQNRNFHYECWSDNSDIKIRMFHRGKKGESTEFIRQHKGGLKTEMEQQLVNAKVLKQSKRK